MSRAAFALLLALLVPGRAAALCCLGGPPALPEAGHAEAHHDPAPSPHAGTAIAPADAAAVCDAPALPVPALRERGPADETDAPLFALPARRAPLPAAAGPLAASAGPAIPFATLFRQTPRHLRL